MGLLEKIRRNAALATGDFEQIFGEFILPPCPEVVLRLTEAINDPDVFIDQVVQILETDAALTSLILKTVNSALYGLPGNVSSVFKAVSILGLKEIENIALGYAMRKAIRDPELHDFDFNIFWTDSLYRALFAKHAAKKLKVESEEAFAAGLLQDMALPVLLTDWFDVYGPVYDSWSTSASRIHEVEARMLSWNHCQAAAWIANKWRLPDLMICCIGLHSATREEIRKLKLEDTAVTAVALSSLVPSIFRAPDMANELITEAEQAGIDMDSLLSITDEVEEQIEFLGLSLNINTMERPALKDIIQSKDDS